MNVPTKRVETTADLGLVGQADGPVEYIEDLEMFVPTYIDERRDLWMLVPGTNDHTYAYESVLMHHVPLEMRGPYIDEETHRDARCWGVTTAGNDCRNKAMNRSGYCPRHGGALHPLDRAKKKPPTAMSRWEKFRDGILKVEELDDDELLKGRIRNEDGSYTRNATIPREMWNRAVTELFNRSDALLQENLLDVIESISEIAKGRAYEPSDRLKAATWIFERIRGKNPDRLVVEQAKPWEMVMEHVVGGSRAESRAARGVAEDDGTVLDAEVVGEDPINEEDELDDSEDTGVDTDGDPTDEERDESSRYMPQPVTTVGPLGKEYHGVPTDPLDRQRYEREVKAERERVAKERKELKERLNAARRRRYAAQARGSSDLALPYGVEYEEVEEGYAVKLTPPKLPSVPRHLLNKEARQRRNESS